MGMEEVRTDPGPSCGAAVIQPEMRLSYWGLMAIACPGENLVPIRDNFKGLGRWSDIETRHFSAVPVFLLFTYSHLISFKAENHFHTIFL